MGMNTPTTTKKAMETANKTVLYERHDDQHTATTILYAFNIGGAFFLSFEKDREVLADGSTLMNLYKRGNLMICMDIPGMGKSAFFTPVAIVPLDAEFDSWMLTAVMLNPSTGNLDTIHFATADLVEESEE